MTSLWKSVAGAFAVLLIAGCAFAASMALSRRAETPVESAVAQAGSIYQPAQRVEAVVRSVDEKAAGITVDAPGEPGKVYRYTDETYFVVDGRAAGPRDLKPGRRAGILAEGDRADYVIQGKWDCGDGKSRPAQQFGCEGTKNRKRRL